jgi:hypothetical protein
MQLHAQHLMKVHVCDTGHTFSMGSSFQLQVTLYEAGLAVMTRALSQSTQVQGSC